MQSDFICVNCGKPIKLGFVRYNQPVGFTEVYDASKSGDFSNMYEEEYTELTVMNHACNLATFTMTDYELLKETVGFPEKSMKNGETWIVPRLLEVY